MPFRPTQSGSDEVDSLLAGGPARFDDQLDVQNVVVAGEQKPVRSAKTMRSVLLVDDTPVIRHLAQHVLEEAGYDAHSAEDGVAALGFLRARALPIDVVVTDLAMPQMDGFTLIRELRKLSPETRIVLMTGYVDAVELAERSAERPDLVLPKPFRPPDLLDAVSAVLLTVRP